MTQGRILIVDDDASLRRVLQVQLEQDGYQVTAAASAQQALSILQLRPVDLMITDLKMPGLSGLELLNHVRSEHPPTVIIVLTAFGTVETAVEAIRAGAYYSRASGNSRKRRSALPVLSYLIAPPKGRGKVIPMARCPLLG